MSKLNLSIAVRDYDRTRPLSRAPSRSTGSIRCSWIWSRRKSSSARSAMPSSTSASCRSPVRTVKTARNDFSYAGVPVFVSRAFRHTSIYVRTDRIKKPADLKGKKIGVAEYQLTANVWARAILDDEYGVKPSDVQWVRGGLEQAGRVEKSP